jgi:hypothetical protein
MEAVKQALEPAGEWLHYEGHCWVLHSGESLQQIRDRIRRVPGLDTANILISEFRPTTCDGWLPEWCWKWINERSGQ